MLGPNEYLTTSAKFGLDMCGGIFSSAGDFGEKLGSQVFARRGADIIKEDAYDDKLEIMHTLGFMDDHRNRRALHARGGDVDAAINMLIESGGC